MIDFLIIIFLFPFIVSLQLFVVLGFLIPFFTGRWKDIWFEEVIWNPKKKGGISFAQIIKENI